MRPYEASGAPSHLPSHHFTHKLVNFCRLRGALNGPRCPVPTCSTTLQSEKHDIESFIIVLAYAVLRHLLINSQTRSDRTVLAGHFHTTFGHKSINHITLSRSKVLVWLGYPVVTVNVSRRMRKMLRRLRRALNAREPARLEKGEDQAWQGDSGDSDSDEEQLTAIPFTHDFLLRELNDTIAKVKK